MTNQEQAETALDIAENGAGEAKVSDYPATMALIGIGRALLALNDTIQNALKDAE